MTETGHPYRTSSGLTPGRVVAFSDGVFSIAMTLLVLNIEIPLDTPLDDVAASIAALSPQLLAYALSFVVLGVYWLVHHRIFALIDRVDTGLLVWNLALLALVALLPFPTSLLDEHGDARVSTVIYAVNVAACSIVMGFTARHAELAGLNTPEAETDEVRLRRAGRWIPGIVFLASVPIAYVSPTAAQLSWLALVPLGMIVNRRTKRRLAMVG